MGVYNRPLNEFGHLLLKHCERQGRTIYDVAKAAKIKGVTKIYFAISQKSPKQRSTPLSDADLERIAKALHLEGEALEELVLTAHLTKAPERLRQYVRRLEQRNSELEKLEKRASP